MKRFLAFLFVLSVASISVFSQLRQPEEVQKATQLLQEEKYDEAEIILLKLLETSPNYARGWYLLASVRHQNNDFKGAVKALEKNLAISQSWPALYNMATAQARLGNKSAALEWLEKALNAGGAFATDIENEEDFAGIMKEPKFVELVKLVVTKRNPCMYSEKARQFDFWIGDWDVFVGGKKVGENLIELETGGCTLIENWKNTTGGTGKSINVYDASVDKWKQFYVGSQGGVFLFEGGKEEGVMRFKAETVDQTGAKTLHNFEFYNLPDKTVRQKWDQSTDNGKTWSTVWDSIYKKKTQTQMPKGKQ